MYRLASCSISISSSHEMSALKSIVTTSAPCLLYTSLSGILGHTKTSFTLDTYTHVTGDMHRKASGIVSEFMNDFVVKE